MAKVIIKIEKEDVKTSWIGNNIMIQCKDGIDIVFDPDSLEELLKDYKILKEERK